jgi:signal transduction histidine kinase
MTDTGAPAPTSAASDWHWMWEAYVVGLCLAAAAAVVLLDDRFPGNLPTPVACVALAGIVVCTLVFGRRLARADPAPHSAVTAKGCAFLSAVVALWLLAVLAAPAAVTAIPALIPLIFATLPLRAAQAVSLLIAATPLGLALLVHGPQWPNLPLAVAFALIGVLAAPLIGTAIMTSMRQRQELSDTVAQLAASRAEASRLSRQAGVAAERERLANEIHDTLAQGFTSIVTLAQAVEAELDTDPRAAARHVELIRNTARDNLAEARMMVTRLTPAALDEASLPAALRRQCDNLAAETGMTVTLRVDGQLPELPMPTNVVLLRTAQEALSNVRKHAGASSASVVLDGSTGDVRLSLSDNGVGLPTDHNDGFGLRGMRSRLAQVGGELTLGTPPGGGLTVTVRVPV